MKQTVLLFRSGEGACRTYPRAQEQHKTLRGLARCTPSQVLLLRTLKAQVRCTHPWAQEQRKALQELVHILHDGSEPTTWVVRQNAFDATWTLNRSGLQIANGDLPTYWYAQKPAGTESELNRDSLVYRLPTAPMDVLRPEGGGPGLTSMSRPGLRVATRLHPTMTVC